MLVVEMPRSELMFSPWKLQLILKGSSPSVTVQTAWANEPSVTRSLLNEMGTIIGGSGSKNAPAAN